MANNQTPQAGYAPPEKPAWAVSILCAALLFMAICAFTLAPRTSESYQQTAELLLLGLPLLLGACCCLMARREIAYKVAAAAGMLLGAAVCVIMGRYLLIYVSISRPPPIDMLLRDPILKTAIEQTMGIAAAICVVALIVSTAYKGPARKKVAISAWLSGIVFFLMRIYFSRIDLSRPELFGIRGVGLVVRFIAHGVCIGLFAMIIYALCAPKHRELVTSAGAKVWFCICILATCGALAAGIGTTSINVASGLTSAVGVLGYVMLLMKRRAGYLAVLIAVITSTAAGVCVALIGYQPSYTAAFAALAGLANPLITWAIISKRWNEQAAATAVAVPAASYAWQQPVVQQPVIRPQPKSCFYVFALQGPAFGSVSGDVVGEKARKLKDDYEPAKDLELRLVRPGTWNARLQSSNTGGLVQVSYNFEPYKDEIRKHLAREGFDSAVIENGIAQSSENSLQLSNPMSGVYVMGIPLVVADAPEPEMPQAVSYAPCVHEFKHYTCVKCGDRAPKPQLPPGGVRKQDQYTYEYYTASTAEEARYFLEQTVVAAPLYYVMVQTPQGEWGRDKDGLFLSQLCDFQRNLSLRQCDAQASLMPERMQDLQIAANKVADNYLLSVTCGECGYTWVDGVGYRTKTIVRCPECGRYNLANTEHIRYNNM